MSVLLLSSSEYADKKPSLIDLSGSSTYYNVQRKEYSRRGLAEGFGGSLGCVWRGLVGPAMAGHGWPWLAIAGHGRPWQAMAGHGQPWQAMAGYGQP